MERLLINLEFVRVRRKGSHVFYRHPDGRTTTLPAHKGRDLARPLVREILREIKLSPKEFQEELEK
jgi:predicted RNA binding protein YcfA (HicA-like mRNA interferase family)